MAKDQYKCVGNWIEAADLEEMLNERAKEGYRVVHVAGTSSRGAYTDNLRIESVVIMELCEQPCPPEDLDDVVFMTEGGLKELRLHSESVNDTRWLADHK